MTDERRLTLRLEEELAIKIKYMADNEKRSLNSQIIFMLESFVKEYEKNNGEIPVELEE